MKAKRTDWETYEGRERDLDDTQTGFICAWCREERDDQEAIEMTRLPEMPIVCINCACGG